jgi:glycosyltransferase involved in cell wall biosynthesis
MARLAYVLPLGRPPALPHEQLAAYPHNQRLLAVLARRHGVQPHAVWSSPHHAVIHDDGVVHHFGHDLGRIVRGLRPDVVHLNGLVFPRLALTLRAAAGRRALLVAQHHGEPPGRGRSRLAQRAARSVIDRYLFCGLPGQAEPWQRAGILRPDSAHFEVLEASTDLRPPPADGPSETDSAAADDSDIETDTATIIWVGRLQEGKDPLTALDGFARFAAHRPARLWLVSPGGALEGVVRRRLPPGAELLGRLDHAELATAFARAHVVLSSSRHEGSGYAVIEAIACGCIPTLSDIAPHRAIGGGLAHYFPPGDPVALAAALERSWTAARDGGGRAAAHRHFELHLSWERVADQLAAAYHAASS